MKKRVLIIKIILSVVFSGSAVCYFLPFFKLNLDGFESLLFNAGDNHLSPFKFIGMVFESSGMFRSVDLSELIIICIGCFIIPFIISITYAGLIHVFRGIKSGIIGCAVAFYGAAANILIRFLLWNSRVDAFFTDIKLSNVIKFDVFGNINLILFILCIAGSVLLIIFNAKKTDSSFENTYIPQEIPNNFGNNVVGKNNNNFYYDDDSPTSFVGNYNLLNTNDTVNNNTDFDNSYEDTPTENLGRNGSHAGSLTCIQGMYKGITFPIACGEEIIIGKSPQQSNIVINQNCDYVSKKHCGVKFFADNQYLIKVYSSNGIFIGNKHAKQNLEAVMSAGDSFSIGNKEHTFRIN